MTKDARSSGTARPGDALPSRAGAGRTLPAGFIAKQFKPGQSGNPSGSRGATYGEVIRLARQHSLAAVERLTILMDSVDERVALLAAQAILDRAFGKPTAPVSIDRDDPTPENRETRKRIFKMLVQSLDVRVQHGRATSTETGALSAPRDRQT